MHEKSLLSSWLRDDMEGKAQEVENMDTKAREEGAQSRKERQAEGGGE